MKKYYQADFTAAQVGALLAYAPLTGLFTYRRASSGRKAGRLAGRVDSKGYFRIRLFGREFKSHRLAWLPTYGVWPTAEIDHRNGLPGDNRIENLRAVSVSENGQNRKHAHRTNKTGLLGVCAVGGRFQAQIKIEGVQQHLGLFDTAEAAHEAYLVAKRKLHPAGTI